MGATPAGSSTALLILLVVSRRGLYLEDSYKMGPSTSRRVRDARTRVLASLVATASLVSCSLSAPTLAEYARSRGAGGLVDGGLDADTQGGTTANTGGEGGGDGGAGMGGGGGGGGDGELREAGAAGAADAGSKCVPEICNGIDDDCDGVVDNGCPSGFLRGVATKQPALGPSAGGTVFTDTCSNDELIVGFQVAISSGWMNQIAAICQKFTLVVDKQVVPYQYSVGFGATELLPVHPATTTDSLQLLNCAGGTVVVGLAVSGQDTGFLVITGISATCAKPVVDLSGSTPQLTWQNGVEIGPINGSSYVAAKATAYQTVLASPQVSIGFHGAAGEWVDQVGLTTSSIGVTLLAP